MTWDKEPRCIAILEPVERQTAHLVFDSKVMDDSSYRLNFYKIPTVITETLIV